MEVVRFTGTSLNAASLSTVANGLSRELMLLAWSALGVG